MQIHCFTAKADGIANCLVTPAGVIDPLSIKSGENVKIQLSYNAIWDTGATNSVICKKVVDECNLQPIDVAIVNSVEKSYQANVYKIDLFLPNHVRVPGLRVTEGNPYGCDLLIGMDVINLGDFAISNFQGKTVFSFRYPSTEEADYVAYAANSRKPASTNKVGRNASCPCGSGKKYKNCCGAHT